jgi:hypothetical protein
MCRFSSFIILVIILLEAISIPRIEAYFTVRSVSSSSRSVRRNLSVESPTVPVSLDELNEQKAGLVFVCSSNRQVKSSLSEVREAVDAVESLGKQVNSEKQTKIADKTIISCVESLLTCFSFFLTHYISI